MKPLKQKKQSSAGSQLYIYADYALEMIDLRLNDAFTKYELECLHLTLLSFCVFFFSYIIENIGDEVSSMKKEYKTLKHYIPEIIEKMNQQNIQYEDCLQGFSVRGLENMKKLKGLLAEYKESVDLPKVAWNCFNIGFAPRGYVWNFGSSEMGVNGSGYPFRQLRAAKKKF